MIRANQITNSEIAADAIQNVNISANAVGTVEIKTNSITNDLIVSGTIQADKLNVSNLSAISADLGTVTAGSLAAGTITGDITTFAAFNQSFSGYSFPSGDLVTNPFNGLTWYANSTALDNYLGFVTELLDNPSDENLVSTQENWREDIISVTLPANSSGKSHRPFLSMNITLKDNQSNGGAVAFRLYEKVGSAAKTLVGTYVFLANSLIFGRSDSATFIINYAPSSSVSQNTTYSLDGLSYNFIDDNYYQSQGDTHPTSITDRISPVSLRRVYVSNVNGIVAGLR